MKSGFLTLALLSSVAFVAASDSASIEIEATEQAVDATITKKVVVSQEAVEAQAEEATDTVKSVKADEAFVDADEAQTE